MPFAVKVNPNLSITEISFIDIVVYFLTADRFITLINANYFFLVASFSYLESLYSSLIVIRTLKFTCRPLEFCFQIKCPLPSYRDLQCKNIDPAKISYAYGGTSEIKDNS